MEVGKSVRRVDAFDKATGRAKYCDDLCDRSALVARVLHSTIANGVVKSIDTSAAEQIEGGVEYEEYPFVLDVQEAMKPDAPLLHEEFPNNILAHTTIRNGNYEEASREPGLIKVEGWYDTPTVQHCHIENHMCFASMEAGRIVIYSSTQIPHIVRRVVGQALGIPWGKVRVVKPYIGGGFGNKQDALYEPLCAYLSTVVGGRLVKLDCTREETFVCNRVRHAIRTHIISCGRTARSPHARSSASRTRALTPPTATASLPRAWARSRSCIPARTSTATPTPCSRTAPPRARCAATASRRPCLRANPTLRTSAACSASTRWSTAAST